MSWFGIGLLIYFAFRAVISGFYTLDQNERGVKTSFGRAQRLSGRTTDEPMSSTLGEEERARYDFPLLKVVEPGGLRFKWPWEKVYKVSVATETLNMAMDLEDPSANSGGTVLEGVTKDQLNIGLSGQIRYRVSESNLYAYLFGVKQPLVHVMGYFISILRERIANFEAKRGADPSTADGRTAPGVSINDLRKNLREINDLMVSECVQSGARYGVVLDASLITGIDPPAEVESALAAINTAHNNVSAEVSRAQAAADQTIVQSKRAVEIETLKAKAEAEPLVAMANELRAMKATGQGVLQLYVRNVRLAVYGKAGRVFLESDAIQSGGQ